MYICTECKKGPGISVACQMTILAQFIAVIVLGTVAFLLPFCLEGLIDSSNDDAAGKAMTMGFLFFIPFLIACFIAFSMVIETIIFFKKMNFKYRFIGFTTLILLIVLLVTLMENGSHLL